MTLWQQMSQVDMQDVICRFTHAQSDFNYMILPSGIYYMVNIFDNNNYHD
jgi:hypothetical protein